MRAYNAEGFGAYAHTTPPHDDGERRMAGGVLFWPLTAVTTFFLLVFACCGALCLAGGWRARGGARSRRVVTARSKRHRTKQRKLKLTKQINLEQIGQVHFGDGSGNSAANTPPEIRNEIQSAAPFVDARRKARFSLSDLPRISRRALQIGRELGKGSFGVVSATHSDLIWRLATFCFLIKSDYERRKLLCNKFQVHEGLLLDHEPTGRSKLTVAIKVSGTIAAQISRLAFRR